MALEVTSTYGALQIDFFHITLHYILLAVALAVTLRTRETEKYESLRRDAVDFVEVMSFISLLYGDLMAIIQTRSRRSKTYIAFI